MHDETPSAQPERAHNEQSVHATTIKTRLLFRRVTPRSYDHTKPRNNVRSERVEVITIVRP